MLRLLILLCSLTSAFVCRADDDSSNSPWDWRGETHLRIEGYDTRGNAAATPYPYSGDQETLGVSFDIERRPNPFDFSRLQFTGTQNHSQYYAPRYGFYPERFNLSKQSGTAALPYQAQVGDYFGVFSYRTLQTVLRGAMVEVQPQFDSPDRRQSFIALSGAGGQSYKDFEWRNSLFTGASYLFEAPRFGRIALNWVNNRRQADETTSAPERRQNVFGGATEIPFSLAGQNLRLETEWTRFVGDHDGSVTDPSSGLQRRDTGVFGELSARGVKSLAPLDWRLRYERYGQDYRPAGAIVTPDRVSREAFAGWRFASGPSLRARYQEFRDGWDSGRLIETDTAGLTLNGPLSRRFLPRWTGNLDGYVQTTLSPIIPIDQRIGGARADISRTSAGGLTFRIGAGYLDIDNRVTLVNSSTTRDVLATLAHAIEFGRWQGSISYGATLRRIDGGPFEGTQVVPLASFSLAHEYHSFLASLSQSRVNQFDFAQVDTRITSAILVYRYDLPQDKLSLELGTNYRSPTPGAPTEAYRAALTWTHFFQRQQAAQLSRPQLGPVRGEGVLDLRELAPGRSLASLANRFQALRLEPSTRPAAELSVYDYRMLEEIVQRQRVGVQSLAGNIEHATLLIDFDDLGPVDTMRQLFERVRQALIRRYGAPASVFDRGEFRPTLTQDLQTDQFIRLTEWRVPEGVIRFGIPRRLDQQVRMEVQIDRSFPDPTQTRWSVEELR